MQRTTIRKLLILLFWLAVWHIASRLLDNTLILVGPADTAKSLITLAATKDFWASILSSFLRIGTGFFGAFFAALLFAVLAYYIPLVGEFLEPLVLLIKSIPVASFVILALIWIGSKNLAVFISASVVFPVIYINTAAGLRSVDKELLEMAQVFCFRPLSRLRYLYLPAVMPYLISASKSALGMSWKF